MLSSSFVEHAALGFAFAVLSLFVLAFAIIAVVLVTITNNCWWNCDRHFMDIEPSLYFPSTGKAEDKINNLPNPVTHFL
ncbi:unnamed protein product [Strongylus vulgaris]|uniref:Uncharacterized protein n=1 Tax=Strongylus vulgaris TaxID=40348 RepID=A0A3P7L6C7_STRVU|nr:unnamed protein product [Strongylus vulgaris]